MVRIDGSVLICHQKLSPICYEPLGSPLHTVAVCGWGCERKRLFYCHTFFPHFILKTHSSTPIIGDNVSCRCWVPQLITLECNNILDKQYKHFSVRLPQPAYLRSLKKEHRVNQLLFCYVNKISFFFRPPFFDWWPTEATVSMWGKKLSTIIFGHFGQKYWRGMYV